MTRFVSTSPAEYLKPGGGTTPSPTPDKFTLGLAFRRPRRAIGG